MGKILVIGLEKQRESLASDVRGRGGLSLGRV